MRLLVQQADVARVTALMRERWADAMAREGLPQIQLSGDLDEHPPCPACGTAAALVDGACSDCGLQLA